MSAQPEDIEIYVKRVEVDEIIDWLSLNFEVSNRIDVASTIKLDLTHNGKPVSCHLVTKAAKGGYTSVWFQSLETPWQNDEECAQSAFKHFDREVRCIASGWQEGDEATGGWYRYTEAGKSQVNWLT